MRYKLIASVLSGVFMFLKKISIRFIRTSTLMRISNKLINKTPIIVTILKKNRFFLTNKIIYIIYIKKLYNFPK